MYFSFNSETENSDSLSSNSYRLCSNLYFTTLVFVSSWSMYLLIFDFTIDIQNVHFRHKNSIFHEMEYGFVDPVFKPYWQEFKDSVVKTSKHKSTPAQSRSIKSGSKSDSDISITPTNCQAIILEKNISLLFENSNLESNLQVQNIQCEMTTLKYRYEPN